MKKLLLASIAALFLATGQRTPRKSPYGIAMEFMFMSIMLGRVLINRREFGDRRFDVRLAPTSGAKADIS